MTSQRLGLRVAALFFTLFTIVHIVRLLRGFAVTMGTVSMPMWASIVAAIVAGLLSIWFWSLSKK